METSFKDGFDRPVTILEISDWVFPENLRNCCPHYICFIVGDASKTADQQIYSFIEQLLQKGMVYMCAWGPDCERVHDIADSVIIEKELECDVQNTIMTTWHSNESLDEALWSALFTTWPAKAFETTCNSATIIIINNDAWLKHIWQRLSNFEQFNADVT